MAGPIQSAISSAITGTAAIATAGKKLHEDEKQALQAESEKKEAESKVAQAIQEEAQATALEADLIKEGADPESAHNFMNAKQLGLSTKGFMFRDKGKFRGSYARMAERLAKDSLSDSFTSKVINDKGFAERLMKLGGTRRGRVEALVGASGGKK